ncbi:hypothetical protein [Streptomyces canus]|nr:hypothetical protein [Streptomyces canus]MDQ0759783.1 hypothetical protein [Streptomyces canus]
MAAEHTNSDAGLAIGAGSRRTGVLVRVALLLGVLVSLFPFY